MPERVQQALLGYAKGHQILASSVDFDGASARLLRTATDMAFDGRSNSYLSVFPLPEAELHAFVRTWPGPDWQRAGSVWSHAIFLSPVQLSRTHDLSVLATMFKMPEALSPKQLVSELPSYQDALTLREPGNVEKRSAFDVELAAIVAAQFYTTDERADIGVGGHDGIDDLILAMLSQQWPGLRRAFAARTRSRASEASWQVGLQIVDRPSSRDFAEVPEWAEFLAHDMQIPSQDFHAFLERYGAASKGGRLAMAPLVELYQSLNSQGTRPIDAIAAIRNAYPRPRQMRLLKRDLVGESSAWTPNLWPMNEPERLSLAFELGSAADLGELNLGERITRRILGSPGDLRVKDISLSNLAPEQVDDLLGAIVEGTSTQRAVVLAIGHPDLGLLVAARKPEVLEYPEVWEAVDADLAVSVFSASPEENQFSILVRLMEEAAVGPLLSICERAPDTWWRLLFSSAEHTISGYRLMDRGALLRQVLDRIGSAAIGLPPRPLRSPMQVILVLLSADLSAGLWRRCPSSTWRRLSVSLDSEIDQFDPLPNFVRDRVHSVALLTANSSSNPTDRIDGWRLNFGYLHERLKDPSFDGEAWRVLANTLPASGADWDRCQRLRKGLAAEIRRDRWSKQSVSQVASVAGASGSEILALIAPVEPPRKKSILREFLDHLFS